MLFSLHTLQQPCWRPYHNVFVKGCGDITFWSRLPGGFCKLTFTDALYVPKLTANLVSLGKLQ